MEPQRPTHAVLIGTPLIGNDDAVDSVACSPHGPLLAVAGTGMIKMWDLAVPDSPRPRQTLIAGHAESINAVAYSPDGRTMVAAGDDGYVILWDVNGTHLTRIGPPLRAHSDPVTSVAFSPDDSQLFASASEDQTAQVWDIGDRAEPLRLGPPAASHQRAVNSVAIGPNGVMATASEDRKGQLWTIAGLDPIKKNPIAYACLRTGRGFNPDEWQSQIPGLPYQKTCPG